jgi:hypothetical protein
LRLISNGYVNSLTRFMINITLMMDHISGNSNSADSTHKQQNSWGSRASVLIPFNA